DEQERAAVVDAGERLEDDRLDPREHRRVRADPDRQRRDDDGRHERHAPDRSPRVAKVVEHQRSAAVCATWTWMMLSRCMSAIAAFAAVAARTRSRALVDMGRRYVTVAEPAVNVSFSRRSGASAL